MKSWFMEHPAAGWLMVTAVLSILFAPKSEELYAKMPTWMAKFFRFMSVIAGVLVAAGVDIPSVVNVLKRKDKDK